MNTKQTNVNQKIKELKEQIDEFESWGHYNVANLFKQELESLIATHKLGTGVKTAQQLKELV